MSSEVADNPLATLQAAANAQSTLDELIQNYKDNFTMTMVKFVFLTILFIGILIYVFGSGGIAEIAKNWPKYRCNPMIMPFAGLYGYDAKENFDYCMSNIFQMNAGAVLGPLYGIMSSFTDIVGTISGVANSFRYLIANLLKGMERLMGSYRDRFQFILFQVRMSFLKILSLMGRLYATFYAVVFMGLSALRTAQNVANNDLVRFLLEFCFDPSTPIQMADGSSRPLSEIKIGDQLAVIDGISPTVTSIFKFDGAKTPMVRIDGVVVSAKHYVYYEPLAHWIEAGEHPEAVFAPSIPELCCLNTNTHTLRVGKFIFADYDESESPDTIKEVKTMAENYLNSGFSEAPLDLSYSLGIDQGAVIRLKSGEVCKITDIRLGDVLKTGGTVLGKVRELCGVIVSIPGSVRSKIVAASQILWDPDNNVWRRAEHLFPYNRIILENPIVLYQLIVSNNIIESEGYVFRDYREVSTPDMETPYEAAMSKKLKPVSVT